MRRVTPLPGLFLSGYWTQPGAGVVSVLLSGVETAAAVLGQRHIGAVLAPDQVGRSLPGAARAVAGTSTRGRSAR